MGFSGKDRFNADNGIRGGNPNPGPAMGTPPRAGFGSEQDPNATDAQSVLTNSPASNPHSSSGFRRALMKTQRTSGRLKNQLPDKTTFSGPGYKKPNYFAQGGRRHGMHIGSGGPAVTPSQGDASEGFGTE